MPGSRRAFVEKQRATMSSKPGALRIHSQTSTACVASLDAYVVCRFFDTITVEDVRATLVAHDACRAYRPNRLGSITVLDPSAKFPSDEIRKASVDAIERTKAHVAAAASVLPGEGFWASAMRGVLTTYELLTGSPHPRGTFKTHREAVDFVLAHTEDDVHAYRVALMLALDSLAPAR